MSLRAWWAAARADWRVAKAFAELPEDVQRQILADLRARNAALEDRLDMARLSLERAEAEDREHRRWDREIKRTLRGRR